MSLSDLSPEYRAIIEAEDTIDASELIFILTVKQSEQADKIATDTGNLRAIGLAAQIRKDVAALIPSHQSYLSKQALVESGEWAEIMSKFNVDLFIQNQSK